MSATHLNSRAESIEAAKSSVAARLLSADELSDVTNEEFAYLAYVESVERFVERCGDWTA